MSTSGLVQSVRQHSSLSAPVSLWPGRMSPGERECQHGPTLPVDHEAQRQGNESDPPDQPGTAYRECMAKVPPTLPTLPEQDRRLVSVIGSRGAVTATRLQAGGWPKAMIHRLIRLDCLREVHTVLGPVYGLTREAYRNYDLLRHPDDTLPAEYVAGPSVMADRAFRVEALAILRAEGYRQVDNIRKARTGIQPRGPYNAPVVSQILRVPDGVARLIGRGGRPVAPYDYKEGWMAQKGYPRLYATIAHQGVSAARLRRLVAEYEDMTWSWSHPLLVALPSNHTLHGTLRAIRHRYREQNGVWMDWSYLTDDDMTPVLRVVEVPVRGPALP